MLKQRYDDNSKASFASDRLNRAAEIRKQIASRDGLGDKTMDNIHEIDSDLPEECIVALSDEIPLSLHYLYSCFTNMKEYCSIVQQSRVVAAYQSYRRILQLLSYQVGEGINGGTDRPRRWVLKSPLHSFFMRELHHVFPDAKFIWLVVLSCFFWLLFISCGVLYRPHRNPERCLSSHCSLVQGMHLMYYERECLDSAQMGKTMLRENMHMISSCLSAVDDLNLDCTHVMYDDVVRNPLDTVRQIYKTFNWKYTAEYEEKVKAYLAENGFKRSKLKVALKVSGQGVNQHNLGEFGLKPQDLDTDVYNSYKKRFNLHKLTL